MEAETEFQVAEETQASQGALLGGPERAALAGLVLLYEIGLRYWMMASSGPVAALADGNLVPLVLDAGIRVGLVLHILAGSRWPVYVLGGEALLRAFAPLAGPIALVQLFPPALVLATCGFLLSSDPVRAWMAERKEERSRRPAGPVSGIVSFALLLAGLGVLAAEVHLLPTRAMAIPVISFVLALVAGLVSLGGDPSRRHTLGMWGAYLSGSLLWVI